MAERTGRGMSWVRFYVVIILFARESSFEPEAEDDRAEDLFHVSDGRTDD